MGENYCWNCGSTYPLCFKPMEPDCNDDAALLCLEMCGHCADERCDGPEDCPECAQETCFSCRIFAHCIQDEGKANYNPEKKHDQGPPQASDVTQPIKERPQLAPYSV